LSQLKTITSFDGICFDYSVTGNGELSFIFVHGWSCNRHFFQPQMDYFASTYTCLAPDLPSRDPSTSNREEWSISTYAQDLTCLIDKAVTGQVVLIGHSMGGAVVLEAASRRPDQVVAVVMADTHVFDYGHLDAATISSFIEPMQADLDGFIQGLVTNTMSAESPQELRDWIIKQMCGASLTVAQPTFESLLNWDAQPFLEQISSPVIAIHSHLLSEQAMQRYANLIKFYALSDTGHFLQLENAQGFNRLLQKSLIDNGVLAN
jgi:pimeloyl-ACP methyl ester carboxylesterase